MAEPEPQADWSEQERAVLAKGDAFLSDGPFSLESGCPGWIKSADYEGSSDVWRGQGCVLFVGDDGKGRTMPFKTTGIVYGVEPATLLAHMTSMDMKWRDKKRKPVAKLVEEVGPRTNIWYEQRALPWPLWNRESTYIEHWELRDGGKTIALAREPCVHPDGALDDSQFVPLRDFSAQRMESDGEGNTRYTISMEFNIGGVVPGALVDGVLTKMASVAEDLTEAFKDEALLAKCKEKGSALMAAAQ